jgi:hypothetical protein
MLGVLYNVFIHFYYFWGESSIIDVNLKRFFFLHYCSIFAELYCLYIAFEIIYKNNVYKICKLFYQKNKIGKNLKKELFN